jgi:hypothetical protein
MLPLLITSLLAALPTGGTVRTYTPAEVARGSLAFRVEGLRPGQVQRARILHHGQLRPVGLAAVRAAIRDGGRVQVPLVPTTPAPADARLVLYTADAPPSPEPPDPAAQTPGLAPCAAGVDSFGPDAWPGPCWRPYADGSPFNRLLPPDPRVDPRSADYVRSLTADGGPSDLQAGTADTRRDWQHPTYYARPGDPTFAVHCWEPYPGCKVQGAIVHIPREARAAGSWMLGRRGDGHMTVVDTVSREEYDFWNVSTPPADVRPGDDGRRVLQVGWGGMTSLDGDGLGSNGTAAYFGNLAGIIRAPELASGQIDHALFLVIGCSASQPVYPAADHGSVCDDQRDAIPLGTRFQLDMSDAEIRALGVPPWKRTILRAMARYGMYAGDTGGSPWDLEFESGSTYTSFDRPDPLVALAQDAGIRPGADGVYRFDLAGGVDWARRLRVVEPCVARGSC